MKKIYYETAFMSRENWSVLVELYDLLSTLGSDARTLFVRQAEVGAGDERRRWDSNPRGLFTLHDFQSCSLGHYETPPALFLFRSATTLARLAEWASSGESGIRTHEGYSPYRFSRAALSTTQTSLRCAVYHISSGKT